MKPIINLFKLFYYRWALNEIDVFHPDVPMIVQRINELERYATTRRSP